MNAEKAPLVSIIALCYNHEDYLQRSLQSLFDQTYSNIEIIIVDDASDDNSVQKIQEITKDHPAIRLIANPDNLGNTTSFNKALKIANGEYIIDFATDDILLPRFVEKQVHNFTSNATGQLGVSFTNVAMVNEDGKHLHNHFKTNSDGKAEVFPPTGYIYPQILKKYLYNSCGMMMKREVLDHLQGYDEQLAYEDLDFLFRASNLYHIGYVDEVLVHKTVLNSSLTSFFYRQDQRSKDLRNTTYMVCQKAYKQNKLASENWALLHRIRTEFILTRKSKHYALSLKYMVFAFKVLFKNIGLVLQGKV